MSKEVVQILSMITLGGLLLSSVGLCLTILTFVLFKYVTISHSYT